MGAIALFILTIAAIIFSAGGILVSRLFTKGSINTQKGQPYECGIPTTGTPWSQFHVGYYLYAIVFLLFDVELVFMYPWAVVVQKIGFPALIEMIFFIMILFIGFLYAHKKRALKWM
ncbi:MAG: NAD(P)H-quinone oxidoreductase subunit 3 [Hydrotalea flava]|uniref:NADH-quinone oxidoreductase subunit A n=1 Tax=Hydrotalea TaxID=1004300 RepID=UPI0009431832|nr:MULTISPECIES: NADH-quinone oxidoreductase subunit A [Hydrotalea]MBY0346783.1 NADH-quinone oxidoreductase subunit A [Hydrotalea flava]NIM36708.1 NAD(P)H-quinone oxidoreductase subunit 3 [Hydrotalea flava]NIM39568.1 NAD(P)H-quinone oxidoreductase subunit 3 [Hydrotalea flava]NIN04757.1 NAD(P)H-quinone oxidoreductase subunit 3 [Hydrotalea flava]NIN16429.1 NAD(P)H-quinone oxidoreductase subunit 3 [Hydrotalea flava]|eukprot:SAG22_NODE_1279_length_4904_cov_2.021228_6_plen_117_part_00